ncbi:MAG: YitT family protein, partial [Defluviitaleaceae bacterium]|nr:YitT family protein [Defluviitaleaceae bacterium]
MIKHWIKKLLWIVFAIGLLAVAVNMFMGPHNIAAGGLTGLAIILESWINIDRTITVYIGNAIVIVAAFIFLGKEVGINTIIGAGLLPVAIDIVPRINLVEDRMLAMIVGSVIFGVAVSIMYKNNASSGGTAVPPLIFKKYFGLKPSIGMFATDGVVVALSLAVFDTDSFFFAVLSIFITMMVMGYIENGLTKRKEIKIISPQHDVILADITKHLGKSVTILPAKGSYSGQATPMLMLLIDSSDYRKLIEIVDKYDKTAFMVTTVVSDVHGRGFTYGSGSV